jgi:uncharacterized protein YcgI (DUF1989 family)
MSKTMAQQQTIPARRGIAARLKAGQSITVINTFGTQVVDAWAFNATDVAEFMSMEHSRAQVRKLCLDVGDSYMTNLRRPILTVVADTSPGRHDTLIASCDQHRYRALGHKGHHDNCTENLTFALAELGLKPTETPSPLNLFMNIPWALDGKLTWGEPISKPGDRITLRAEMDAIVVFSACPMDLLPINGKDCIIRDAHFEIA